MFAHCTLKTVLLQAPSCICLVCADVCYVHVHSSTLTLTSALPAGYDLALLMYISMLGSAASYGVFFYNASRGNLTALSSLTFLTPMFAAGCGYLTIGESLTPLQLVGAGITLGGVALINAKPVDKEGSS